jgi:hypothetical protein
VAHTSRMGHITEARAITLCAARGAHECGAELVTHGEPPVTVAQFITRSELSSVPKFVDRVTGRWVLVVSSIYLREGSLVAKARSRPAQRNRRRTGNERHLASKSSREYLRYLVNLGLRVIAKKSRSSGTR